MHSFPFASGGSLGHAVHFIVYRVLHIYSIQYSVNTTVNTNRNQEMNLFS